MIKYQNYSPHIQYGTILPGEIHIRLTSLDKPADMYYDLLSNDERQRAGNYRFEADRERFTVRRGLLRELLGTYLSIDPKSIDISYGKYGKPALSRYHPDRELYFNTSHSEELALYAFTFDGEVGIDIEHIRNIPDMLQVAARCFPPEDNAILNTLPENERIESFFSCWTQNEAIIKATGEGMFSVGDRFDFPLVSHGASGLPADAPNTYPGFYLKNLNHIPGYAAAVAIRTESPEIRLFNITQTD